MKFNYQYALLKIFPHKSANDKCQVEKRARKPEERKNHGVLEGSYYGFQMTKSRRRWVVKREFLWWIKVNGEFPKQRSRKEQLGEFVEAFLGGEIPNMTQIITSLSRRHNIHSSFTSDSFPFSPSVVSSSSSVHLHLCPQSQKKWNWFLWRLVGWQSLESPRCPTIPHTGNRVMTTRKSCLILMKFYDGRYWDQRDPSNKGLQWKLTCARSS